MARPGKAKSKAGAPDSASNTTAASQPLKTSTVSLQKRTDENSPAVAPVSRAALRGQDSHIVQTKGLQVNTQEERSQAAAAKREAKEALEAKEKAEIEQMRRAISEKYKQLADLQDKKNLEVRKDIEDGQQDADDDGGNDNGKKDGSRPVEVDSDERAGKKAPKNTKPSEKEKRDARVKDVRGQIDSYRQDAPVVSLQKRKPVDEGIEGSRATSSKKSRAAALEGLDDDWKAAHKSDQKKTSKRSKKKSKEESSDSDSDIVETGAFGDDGVRTERGDVQLLDLAKQLLAVEAREKATPKSKSAKPTSSRKPPSTPADGQARSFDALFAFEQKIYHIKLRPSILSFGGALPMPGPHDVDHGHKRLFFHEVREILKEASPENYYDVQPANALSKELRQALVDWRRRFGSFGIFFVSDAIKDMFAPGVDKSKPKLINGALAPSKEKIKDFVAAALAVGGAAFWATPGPRGTRSGALSSIYVLKVFANAHLNWVQGSVMEYTAPYGAISLSLAGVERGFEAWSTGEYLAPKPFADKEFKDNCQDYYRDSVLTQFSNNPGALIDFVHAALRYCNATVPDLPAIPSTEPQSSRRAIFDDVVDFTAPQPDPEPNNHDNKGAEGPLGAEHVVAPGPDGVIEGKQGGDGERGSDGKRGDQEGGDGQQGGEDKGSDGRDAEERDDRDGEDNDGYRERKRKRGVSSVVAEGNRFDKRIQNEGVMGGEDEVKADGGRKDTNGGVQNGEAHVGAASTQRARSVSASSMSSDGADPEGWAKETFLVQMTTASINLVEPPREPSEEPAPEPAEEPSGEPVTKLPERRKAAPKVEAEAWTRHDAPVQHLRIRYPGITNLGPYTILESECVDPGFPTIVDRGGLYRPNIALHEGWDAKNVAIRELCHYEVFRHYAARFNALITAHKLQAALLSVADFDILEETQVLGGRKIWLRCGAVLSHEKLHRYSISKAARHPESHTPPTLIKDTLDAFNHYMRVHRDHEACEEYVYLVGEGNSKPLGIEVVYTRKHTNGEAAFYYGDGGEKKSSRTWGYHKCNTICEILNLNSPEECTSDIEIDFITNGNI